MIKLKGISSLLFFCISGFSLLAFPDVKNGGIGVGKSVVSLVSAKKEAKPLAVLQQEFLDLRFGMFICLNMSTYSGDDWADPNLAPEMFNPVKLDCSQWADAAVSAGMTYGCLTTKHADGFCLWPTTTTDHSVTSGQNKRDIVAEYVDAFRKKGLKVFLYYSILDMHHNIKPGWIKKEDTQFIMDQLTELLTNYGKIDGLLFDSWDAGWSRISYEDISFERIYKHIKSLQPECLVSEHNSGKYPQEGLFYADIKHYEQNAGQKISKETNQLPAQAGIPINSTWFWKENSPAETVKNAKFIVEDNLVPLNDAHCNFILSMAPNRNGLIDANAIEELKEIGKLWKNPGRAPKLTNYKNPIICSNLAKKQKMNSSWSSDMYIADLANDDNFYSCWIPSPQVKEPFLEIVFDQETTFNAVGIVELSDGKSGENGITKIESYNLQYWDGKGWENIQITGCIDLIRFHRFNKVRSSKIRLQINKYKKGLAIAELLVYNEKL